MLGEKGIYPLSLLPSALNSGCNNWQMILICRFKVQKQLMTINNACYSANTNKHIQVAASHSGHVGVCGMNVLWHGQAVNLGHLNDWCRLSHHLISYGDQRIAVMAGVEWTARPCCGRLGLVTRWGGWGVLKKKVDRKGKGDRNGKGDLEVVCLRRCEEMQGASLQVCTRGFT